VGGGGLDDFHRAKLDGLLGELVDAAEALLAGQEER
jgi:hypothetical protein